MNLNVLRCHGPSSEFAEELPAGGVQVTANERSVGRDGQWVAFADDILKLIYAFLLPPIFSISCSLIISSASYSIAFQSTKPQKAPATCGIESLVPTSGSLACQVECLPGGRTFDATLTYRTFFLSSRSKDVKLLFYP